MAWQSKLQAAADASSWRRLLTRKLGKPRLLRNISKAGRRYPTARRLNWLATNVGALEYLEIGVHAGLTFERVSVPSKWGVDPTPRFNARRLPPNCRFTEATSDDFFRTPNLGQFDLIFIDGWHDFNQVLRDLRNSLAHLSPSGVIVIDDVYPGSALAATPYSALASQRDEVPPGWTGDVFKVVFLLSLLDPKKITFCTMTEGHLVQTVVLGGAGHYDMDNVPPSISDMRWQSEWDAEVPGWMNPLRDVEFRSWLASHTDR